MNGLSAVYAQLGRIVGKMSLAIYQGQTLEISEEEVWVALTEGAHAIADVAERLIIEEGSEG